MKNIKKTFYEFNFIKKKIKKDSIFDKYIFKIIDIFKTIDFEQIENTSFFVPSFLNSEHLNIPQQHPAQEMQNTFYISKKKKISKKMLEKIKKINKMNWGLSFSKKKSERILLRTHTTKDSVLEYLKKKRNLFIIGKIFRNENIDKTHLNEFHQVEGLICGKDANLIRAKEIISFIYSKLGFDEIYFKNAYFPYTEPSFEIFAKHGDKWVELGGVGMFRQEITGGKNYVVGFGLGLERLIMIKENIQRINQLFLNE